MATDLHILSFCTKKKSSYFIRLLCFFIYFIEKVDPRWVFGGGLSGLNLPPLSKTKTTGQRLEGEPLQRGVNLDEEQRQHLNLTNESGEKISKDELTIFYSFTRSVTVEVPRRYKSRLQKWQTEQFATAVSMAFHGYQPMKSLYKGPENLSQWNQLYRRADHGGCQLLETATVSSRRQTALMEQCL